MPFRFFLVSPHFTAAYHPCYGGVLRATGRRHTTSGRWVRSGIKHAIGLMWRWAWNRRRVGLSPRLDHRCVPSKIFVVELCIFVVSSTKHWSLSAFHRTVRWFWKVTKKGYFSGRRRTRGRWEDQESSTQLARCNTGLVAVRRAVLSLSRSRVFAAWRKALIFNGAFLPFQILEFPLFFTVP